MSDIENQDFEYYLKEGKKLLFDYENQKDALNLFKKATELNPKSSEAISLRGRCKLEIGDYRGAVIDFSEVTRKDSAKLEDFISYWIASGLNWLVFPKLEGSLEYAIENFLKAIELHPTKEDAYLLIEHIKRVIEYINENILLNSKNNQNYFLRGSSKYALGKSYDLIDAADSMKNANWNYQIAIKDFDKVIELNSKSEVALLRRGICKYRSGYLNDGIKDFDRLIEIKPDSAEAFAHKGIAKSSPKGKNIKEIIRRYHDANSHLKQAIDLDSKFFYLNKLIENNKSSMSEINKNFF